MLLTGLDLAAGAVFLLLGAVSWPRSRWASALGVSAGVAWFLAGAYPALVFVHRPLMVWVALVGAVGRLGGPGASVAVPLLFVGALPQLGASAGVWWAMGGVVLVAAWRMPVGPSVVRRRSGRVALAVLAVAFWAPPALRILWGQTGQPGALFLYTTLVLLAGAALAAGELRSGSGHALALIELPDRTPAQTMAELREVLAATRSPSRRHALERTLGLLESNATLQAGLEARLAEVRDSRARLLVADTEERRRVQESLKHGATAYLDELESVIQQLAAGATEETRHLADRCLAEVAAAEEDLAQLARGLHPRALTDEGLASALSELAGHTPLPLSVEAPSTRFPEPVETALWYACSEALTNLVKHAKASSGALTLAVGDGRVTARIRDDGVGGAHVEPGGGLAGLRDRLASVHGELTVLSPPSGGTEVVIEVPVR